MEKTSLPSDVCFSIQNLCRTLNGNRVPLVTITGDTMKNQVSRITVLTHIFIMLLGLLNESHRRVFQTITLPLLRAYRLG